MKKLRILVIDDNQANIAKAVEQFSNSEKYELTTASSYEKAKELLSFSFWDDAKGGWISIPKDEWFDVVFTDLFLPEDECACRYNSKPSGKEYPYGIAFALDAIKKGIKMVAIVTSWNHNNESDTFIDSIKDMVGNSYGGYCNGIIQLGQTKFFFCDHKHVDPWGKEKNWQKVLDALLA